MSRHTTPIKHVTDWKRRKPSRDDVRLAGIGIEDEGNHLAKDFILFREGAPHIEVASVRTALEVSGLVRGAHHIKYLAEAEDGGGYVYVEVWT